MKGYRTYIICAIALLTLGLSQYNIIPADSIKIILEILGVGAVTALRSAIANKG